LHINKWKSIGLKFIVIKLYLFKNLHKLVFDDVKLQIYEKSSLDK